MTKKKTRNSHAVIVFLKDPVCGEVKTRIGHEIGMEKAAVLYRQLVNLTRKVLIDFPADIRMFVNKSPENFQRWRREDCFIDRQSDGDLGDKMLAAFQEMELLYDKILLIGTDCPELDKNILNSAFKALDNHQLVLGPAVDGGYYLIGSQISHPDLFRGIPWSTDEVLQKTMCKAKSLGLSVFLLPQLRDIDTMEDVKYYKDLG